MNKRIEIDGTYFIEVDDYNWMLKKHVKTAPVCKNGQPSKNAGKLRDVTLGYCSSLGSALDLYADRYEKDEISKATRPVSIGELKTILLRVESACKALKLVEKGAPENG
jgi:hypothetical protein